MNIMQKLLLPAGIAVIAVMVLYPPWSGVRYSRSTLAGDGRISISSARREEPLGYAPIFSPPEVKDTTGEESSEVKLNSIRLVVQCAAVAVVTGALFIAGRDKKKREPKQAPEEAQPVE